MAQDTCQRCHLKEVSESRNRDERGTYHCDPSVWAPDPPLPYIGAGGWVQNPACSFGSGLGEKTQLMSQCQISVDWMARYRLGEAVRRSLRL